MHAFDRRTDRRGQTDRNLIARPRLHCMQRVKTCMLFCHVLSERVLGPCLVHCFLRKSTIRHNCHVVAFNSGSNDLDAVVSGTLSRWCSLKLLATDIPAVKVSSDDGKYSQPRRLLRRGLDRYLHAKFYVGPIRGYITPSLTTKYIKMLAQK